MHNLALDYASPAGLKAGVNYTSYQSESNQDFTNKNREENTSRFQTTSGQNIDRWKIYMDREHAINNMGTLSYGASLTYAHQMVDARLHGLLCLCEFRQFGRETGTVIWSAR